MSIFCNKSRATNVVWASFIGILVISLLIVETLSAETRYRVKSSDNVNTIVERFYQGSDLSKSQLLVGVLIKNPRAFRGGNINFLLRGKRLTLPDESDIQKISSESASELLSEHARFFRFGLTGDLPPPTFANMANVPEAEIPNDSNTILKKQENQTRKINKLQQESDALKLQLEALVNEKGDRDQRLRELEESLKQTLSIAKQSNPVIDSANKSKLEASNKVLKQKLNKTKSELAENSKSNTALERKVENLQEVLDGKVSIEGGKRIIEPSSGILSKLAWLIPLLLLVGLFFYFFAKKKSNRIEDDKIEVNKSGFIESYGDNTAIDIQQEKSEQKEDALETSVKLDVARAYIEAEDTQSALDILAEIMEEGSDEQRKQAHDLLETISPSLNIQDP